MTFNCEHCDASYPVRKSLFSHMRLKHGDAKQYYCEHCVYKTTKKENLKQHVRSLHQGIKEICETCGKNFSDKSNLNKHVRQFHLEILQGIKRKAADPFPQPAKRERNDPPIPFHLFSLSNNLSFSNREMCTVVMYLNVV